MTPERWNLEALPTRSEVYEAMVAAGRTALNGRDRAVVMALSLFTCVLAPFGATMLLWVVVNMSVGSGFDSLPVATIPVSLLVFGGLTLWLTRRPYMMIAQFASQSRFGSGYRVQINPQGIAFATNHSRWHSGWADVESVQGGKLALTICISGVALPLPRRAFAEPDDPEEALAAMQRWQEVAA